MAEEQKKYFSILKSGGVDYYVKDEEARDALLNINECVALANIPTDTTLSYSVIEPATGQSVTKQFKVGDRVVAEDHERGDEEYGYLMVYTLLKLYKDGNADKALWAPCGGSGDSGTTGKIRVNLSAIINGAQVAASNLNGVTATLTNTTDNLTVATKTWQGTQLVFAKLTPLKAYRVTVADKAGFKKDYDYQDIASLDVSADITKSFEFSAIEYTVEMTSNQDETGQPDADLDRTSDGVYLTGSYSYGGQTVSFGERLHHGDKVRMPADTDTSTISITDSATVTGYAKTPTVDVTNKKLVVAYSTTKVFALVGSNQDSAVTSDVVTKVGGTVVTELSYVKVPTGSTIAFTTENDIAGYQKVVTNDGTATGKTQTIQVTYNAELVSVYLAADQGTPDLSASVITLYDASNDSAIATATAAMTAQPVASGISYYVGVSGDVTGYATPAHTTPQTAASTANAVNSVTMTYNEQTAPAGFVNLGLPSGLKWAQGNIVKDEQGNYSIGNETDYGCYFSWGNIIGHNNGEGYDFGTSNSGPYASTPGAQVSANIASNDASHDVALACFGAPWHMPTKEDFKELYDNTDREWTSIDGINGWKFMKKTDHSVYVFFPAAGRGYGTSVNDVGTYGYYWSSSWYSANNAYSMSFNSSSVNPQNYNRRYYGFSVRAVQ